MISAFQLVFLVLPSLVMSASVKKMLNVETNKRSVEENKMVIDHIVEVKEGETAFLPSPTTLPGQPDSVSWTRRGKEISR